MLFRSRGTLRIEDHRDDTHGARGSDDVTREGATGWIDKRGLDDAPDQAFVDDTVADSAKPRHSASTAATGSEKGI